MQRTDSLQSIRTRRQPKHERITGRLRQQILSGALKPGDTIPSYRSLMQTHDATANTVRQAVMTLQAAGLIESAPGVGCIVAKQEAKRHTVGIAMVGHSEPDPMARFVTDQLTLVHDQLDQRRCDLSLRFVPDVNEDAVARLVSWARRWDGVLLTGIVPAHVAQAVADAGVPLVLVGEPSDRACPGGISHVAAEVRNLVHLAVSHLVGLGHRRMVLCSCHGSRYFDLVAEAFRASMADYHLEAEALEWYFERDDVESCAKFLPWLAGLPQPPTAMVVEEGTRATTLVRLLGANGWLVPERMSVLAITGAAHQPKSMEGLSCILTSTREMILRAVDMLLEVVCSGGRTVRVEKIAATCIAGCTCCAPRGRAPQTRGVGEVGSERIKEG